VTVLAQLCFVKEANGSLIMFNNNIIGSALIGQAFTDPRYFWGRPSATKPFPYNGARSGGSNLSLRNPKLLEMITARSLELEAGARANQGLIPVELVTASASGLDPDISPLAAFYQVPRIAKIRNIAEVTIQKLIYLQIKNRPLGLLGEPRINVLQLNIALDQLKSGVMHEEKTSEP
jgi:K+-transporting ATPase ATPase C chain